MEGEFPDSEQSEKKNKFIELRNSVLVQQDNFLMIRDR